MKKILSVILLFIVSLSCKEQEKKLKIPVELSLLVVTPYEKKFETGYAFEARIYNNQNKDVAFVSPTIFIEKLEANGEWLNIFKESPYDFLNRNKLYPYEGKQADGFRENNKNGVISKKILEVLKLPINSKNVRSIGSSFIYMTFMKKDSLSIFSKTMNNVLNVGVNFLSHQTLKGKFRVYCKIEKEHLFRTIKLWDAKNSLSEHDLPKNLGSFKFIENPQIQSDTIHFEIY